MMNNYKKIRSDVQETTIMSSEEFTQTLAPYYGMCYSFALRLTGDRDRAKDLMQETLMRAYHGRNNFTKGTNFKAWMTTIMHHSFINEYRKIRTRNQFMYSSSNPDSVAEIRGSVSNMAYSNLMRQELALIMHTLSDLHRIPFEMFFNGTEYLEIAEKLHLPMGTVKSRIFFARKKLKQLIYENYGENVRCA